MPVVDLRHLFNANPFTEQRGVIKGRGLCEG